MARSLGSRVVLGLAVIAWAAPAIGQPTEVPVAGAAPAGPVSTDVRTQLATSYNNPGLQWSLDWSTRRLTRPEGGRLTSDAHVALGSSAIVSPSNARLGVWAQYAPLSIAVLRAGVEPAQYFGTFDSLMTFDRQDVPFDNATRRDRGGASAGRALRLYVTPTLRLRAGRVVAQVSGDIDRWFSSAGGTWFYEPTRDTLLRSSGSLLTATRAVVMYEHATAGGTRVGLGGLHTFQQVDRRRLNEIQRLGLIGTLQSERPWRFLKRPAVNLIVARYLEDPSKDGEYFAALTVATTLRRR